MCKTKKVYKFLRCFLNKITTTGKKFHGRRVWRSWQISCAVKTSKRDVHHHLLSSSTGNWTSFSARHHCQVGRSSLASTSSLLSGSPSLSLSSLMSSSTEESERSSVKFSWITSLPLGTSWLTSNHLGCPRIISPNLKILKRLSVWEEEYNLISIQEWCYSSYV